MSFNVTCYTLFDITQTGVLNRSKPITDMDPKIWVYMRNTQCNFDTVLQVISLRAQPEGITTPQKISIRFDTFENFGFLFTQEEDNTYPCWKFTFEINHPAVFHDGINDLGNLYKDCHNVPMMLCGTEWNKLPSFLDGSPELKNIYFEINHA
jgi:hypothetical protein